MSRILQIDGLPVLNATEPLLLKVTGRDVAKATLKQPNECAVARACARQFHVKEARVHLGRIYLRTNETNWVRYMTPKPLRDEIIAFDRGGAFEPGEYTIGAVDKWRRDRAGRTQGGKSTPKAKRSGKRRRAPHVVQNVRGGPAGSGS